MSEKGEKGEKEQPKAAPPPGPPPKPQPKNPGFVTATVDGREVVVKPGTNMIEAAKTVGSEIPYYCYHPRLTIAANCRMCLVEVSNAPKLVPACQTPLSEGLVVKTATPRVQEQQRAVMEFLLLNHPVDCSICDQAGECKLQDYYMRYDHKPSRLEGSKILKSKRKVLGPQVVLDQERCILCTRCVRFMQEVAKEPQLGLFGRGSNERIDTFPGAALDSNYSGNTVDICPVGALLNRDFRFRARAWFLSSAPSACTGCSRNCSTFVDFYGQDAYRYRPRENEAINKSWMCDQGRLTYKEINRERLLQPLLGRGPEARDAAKAEAARVAATKLSALAGTDGLAVTISPNCTNENIAAAMSFAKDVLKVSRVYASGRPMGAADHYLLTADRNANRKGLEWIAAGFGLTLQPFDDLLKAMEGGQVKALWAVGGEVPVDDTAFRQAAEKLELFVLQAQNESSIARLADVLLPACSHVEDEGSIANLDGIVQRIRQAFPPKGESQPHWRWVSDLHAALGITTTWASAREVWRALSNRVPELASFEWDTKAPPAREARGLKPIPAAADGRPPGYREYGAPRVRGI
ncbi:MAG TPA: 2Fe-2S iron-sulfur cluster-binding protein [Myxococcaceae bacterium]|nr:2Fe-2S iron-sulfur cluster-binding protein [Myxococcaceae bacterium]